jgi:cysteine desulfurase / selenocysteine lyase
MPQRRRLYLDNAATSSPKPPAVWEAMARYVTEVGASPGRGNYAEAREGARLIRRCRERINTLINGESPDHVVFTLNTTDALNMAIKGVVRHRRLTRPGRSIHLVATQLDHNSVLRPLHALRDEGVEVSVVGVDAEVGTVDLARVRAAIGPDTALVVLNHASNVTGAIQPAADIGRFCRERGVLFLLDVAQSLGHLPVDVRAIGADLLAFPGHKGLLGPTGTGGLYFRPGVERLVATTREGGTGSIAELDAHPDRMPERYEPGSHNAIGIAGLSEGVAYLLDHGVERTRADEVELMRVMLEALDELGAIDGSSPVGLRLLGPADVAARVGVFSLVHGTLRPAELADLLERRHGVLARAGIHCAPRAHESLGTLTSPDRWGATRLSLGPFLSVEDVRRVCEAVADVAGVAAPV